MKENDLDLPQEMERPLPARMILESTIFYFHDGELSRLDGTTLIDGASHLIVHTRNGIPHRAELIDSQGRYLG